MSTSLYLMHLRPQLNRLLPWAHRHGLVAGNGQGDLGYAFHAALKAVFADLAPQPFSYRQDQGLLAYSAHGEALKSAAAMATPEVAEMLGLEASSQSSGLLIRPFPQAWKPEQLLSFELRVRPIVRTKDGRERDVYLSAIERKPDAGLSRQAVYTDWLKWQFSDVADLHEVQMTEFQLSAVVRRSAPSTDGKRAKQPVLGPNAVLTGVLQVRDSEAFATLVSRGVGRHRAFGFGMLLLKPAAPAWD